MREELESCSGGVLAVAEDLNVKLLVEDLLVVLAVVLLKFSSEVFKDHISTEIVLLEVLSQLDSLFEQVTR